MGLMVIQYIIIGCAAFFMSIASGIAGAGGGLVMAPLMLLLGFPPQTVLASSKAGGLGINIGALSKFIRQRNLVDWRWAGALSALAVVASLLGTRLVFVLSAQTLEYLIAGIAIAIAIYIFLARKIGLADREVSQKSKLFGAVLAFLVMGVQAGLGSGIGVLLMLVMMGPLGFGALRANATKRVSGLVLVLVLVSFIIFALSGLIDWALAASLFFGMLLGGYIGARLAIKHGNKLVKNALLVVVIAMCALIIVR